MTQVHTIISEATKAFNSVERINQLNELETLSEFIMPSQSGLFVGEDSPGQRRTRRLYSSVPPQANKDLASAMVATLINVATKWAKINFRSQELKEDSDAMQWIDQVTNLILKELEDSNFYIEAGKSFQSYTGFGTMALNHEERNPESEDFSGFVFKSRHLSTMAWTSNAEGIADKIFHKTHLTLRQIEDKFGEVPAKLKKVAKEDPEYKTPVLMAIVPDVKNTEMPYGIWYIALATQDLLLRDRRVSLPEYVVRWDSRIDEEWGFGPGHMALPDILSLNMSRREGLEAKALANRPPLAVSADNQMAQINMIPLGRTVLEDINGIKPLNTGANLQSQDFTEKDLEDHIKKVFLLDKLMLPPRTETGEMTAFEVSSRIEQMNRVIGPTLSRLNVEFLQPLITRCFRIMFRKGAFPEVPQSVIEAGGVSVDIVFDNPLSRSQRFEEISSLQQWTQLLTMYAQFDPSILLAVNSEEIGPETAQMLGVPAKFVRSKADIRAIKEDQQKQMQQQQRLDQGQQAAQIQQLRGQ